MGQQDIFNLLKNNKGSWFSKKDISLKTGLGIGSVNRSVNSLMKRKEIKKSLFDISYDNNRGGKVRKKCQKISFFDKKF